VFRTIPNRYVFRAANDPKAVERDMASALRRAFALRTTSTPDRAAGTVIDGMISEFENLALDLAESLAQAKTATYMQWGVAMRAEKSDGSILLRALGSDIPRRARIRRTGGRIEVVCYASPDDARPHIETGGFTPESAQEFAYIFVSGAPDDSSGDRI
jgi:hypothetical protein